MEKQFKITNTNTRKTFSSLAEVNAHVSKTKLRPLDGSNTIFVEEITSKMHSINLISDNITIETFHKLIDKILNKLSAKTEVTYTDDSMSILGTVLRAVKDLDIPEALEHFKTGMILLEIDYHKFDNAYNNSKYDAKNAKDWDEKWEWLRSTFKKSEDTYGYQRHRELVKSTSIIILNHLKSSNTIPEKFKVIKLRTNYKPCNAIGIKSTYLSIGWREGGPVIGRSMFTGRKVSYTGDEVLTERSLSKILKENT
jgi:hypothetical protein